MLRVCTRFTFLLVLAGLAIITYSQNQPAIDSSAVFKTVIPHQQASLAGIRAAHPVGAGTAAAPAAFSGPPYKVGATITPTSSVPEAEEHIAVDPSNFNNLVAMISDFSILRGGFKFNTSKLAVSTNNGTSWSEAFVPLNAAKFPVTADNHVWQANSDPVVAIDKPGKANL